MSHDVASPGLSFLAGVLTVASPCVVPMLPVVMGATVSGGPGFRPVFVVAGFVASFTLLGMAFGTVQHLLGLQPETIRDAAALMLVAFGLSMIWPGAFSRLSLALGGVLNRVASLGDRAGPGWAGGLLIGVSLGAVWTPCAGPVLATILTLVASQSNWGSAVSLLGLYALGAALPMFTIAYGGRMVLARVRSLARHAHRLQQLMGFVVVVVGLLTYLQQDTQLTLWLSEYYPSLSLGI